MIKLYLVCFCVLVVLVFTTINIRNESSSFFGLADTTEIILNSESAVEIKKLRVTPGQFVNKGDTLAELNSYELEIRINETSHLLDELKTKSAAHKQMTQAQIRQIKSEQEEKINALKTEVQPIQAQYELNKKLLEELKSMRRNTSGKEDKDDSTSPVAIQINNLQKQIKQTQDSIVILVDRVRKDMSYEGDPLADQINRTTEELRMLKDEKKKLFIVAQINGLIGAVNFKNGERVSPFTTIATLHAQYPTFINGYIHENAYSKVKIGQKVKIESLAESHATIIGTITGVGSRIVEYPVRLRRMPEVQMWGREVIISIPGDNKFFMGEKVVISFIKENKIPFLGVLLNLFPVRLLFAEALKTKSPSFVSDETKKVSGSLPDGLFSRHQRRDCSLGN